MSQSTRLTGHFNALTESELERLAILSEECGEVIQQVGKILRHGYDSGKEFGTGEVNRHGLERELADLLWILGRMERAGDVNPISISIMEQAKEERAARYLHHQGK